MIQQLFISEVIFVHRYLSQHWSPNGTLPARQPYLDTRNEEFAQRRWTIREFDPTAIRMGDFEWRGLMVSGSQVFESAQSAVEIGNLLGYRTDDIAAYLKRNHVDRNINGRNWTPGPYLYSVEDLLNLLEPAEKLGW
jgi:hypothetical protein